MDRSLEQFVDHQNIERFRDQLKLEGDPLKRKVLLDLVSEAEAKRANHIQSKEK